MYNQEILDLILQEYGVEKTAQFCEMVAMMYDIKFNACKELEPLSEYDYERNYWINESLRLHEQKTI
jgi:hypothetical protein